jgi:hypothetical protein
MINNSTDYTTQRIPVVHAAPTPERPKVNRKVVITVCSVAAVLFSVLVGTSPTPAQTFGGFLIVGILFVAYFIPAIIAVRRSHANKLAIFVLNVFGGWTCVGWIVALVWSLSNDGGAHRSW